MPYQLKIENISSYMQDCHFCEESMCRTDCALPFCSKTTVLDMLKKVGVEDNVSFYGGNRQTAGKKDFMLYLRWQKDFRDPLQTHLSSVERATRVDN